MKNDWWCDPSGMGFQAAGQMGVDGWRLLLEAGLSSNGPDSSRVLRTLHSVVCSFAGHAGAVFQSAETGVATDVLCGYLDLVLVPHVLKQPALKQVSCPCERCLLANQAIHALKENAVLQEVSQLPVVPFLVKTLVEAASEAVQELAEEEASVLGLQSFPDGVYDVVRAAETVAVVGTYLRLQGSSAEFNVPHSAVQSVIAGIRECFREGNRFGTCFVPGRILLGALHVLRNVATNHAEVMSLSSEIFGECAQALWRDIESPAMDLTSMPPVSEGSSFSSRSSIRRRRAAASDDSWLRHQTQSQHGAGGSSASNMRRRPSTNDHAQEDASPGASVVNNAPDPGRAWQGDGGNPQESDEHTSGAEFGPVTGDSKPAGCGGKDGVDAVVGVISSERGQETVEQDGSTNIEADRKPGESSGTTCSTAPQSEVSVVDQNSRSAELIGLYSLVLQSLFQSDDSLKQTALMPEEAVRLQMVLLARSLRVSELASRQQSKLAFQGIRLYLLVCRSSHVRRQYVVLQQSFVEEERRAVAILLSMTPSVQRCCVLLRVMSQDVQSWLLWQAQAPSRINAPGTRTSPSAAGGMAASATVVPPRVMQHRRRRPGVHPPPAPSSPPPSTQPLADTKQLVQASSSSGSTTKKVTGERVEATRKRNKHKALAETQAGKAQECSDVGTGDAETYDAPGFARLFTSEEAVWLLHAALVLAIVLCLGSAWHSLERPRGSAANSWRFGP